MGFLTMSDTKDLSQIHQRAQILVMTRLVDAKSHIKDLDVWMKVQYVVATVSTCVTLAVFGVYLVGAPVPYLLLVFIALTAALWLKYLLISYHYAYQCKQLERAQHAMQTLSKHHYTEEQHAAIIKKHG